MRSIEGWGKTKRKRDAFFFCSAKRKRNIYALGVAAYIYKININHYICSARYSTMKTERESRN